MIKYFNGFSLKDEEALFEDIITDSDYTVVGFSHGAQKAFEYAYTCTSRIDKLILLSPAFFQTQKKSFIRAQLRYFETDKEAYVAQFLENTVYASNFNLDAYLTVGRKEELEALLTYIWDIEKIEQLKNRGTVIEVFLGDNDKIINSKEAFDFFTPLAITYFFRDKGHLLIA